MLAVTLLAAVRVPSTKAELKCISTVVVVEVSGSSVGGCHLS